MDTHGSFVWNELNTRDPERAKAFYAALLGWAFEPMAMPEGTYWLAKVDGRPVAGIFTMNGAEFDGIPEHWFPYLSVSDIDAAAAAVPTAAGQVLRAPWDVPGVGRIAILRDVNGAAFGAMTPVPMPEPSDASGLSGAGEA
ncbi:VOC family protein [Prosthecodimorpha staleyi]|uniref:VOC family protein n=1 Tax=Prosthecodimorpha staleyi TaxID=2840188 RepID=A0A947D513_9HYPH|nr:VOC family protein [Prosthecodimorpha staleyi]MBT9290890.1 VOC family protein [Prosthecodimorpha staleyi]